MRHTSIFVVCFLISKKGRIIEDRIIRKTNGCKECDTLVLKMLKKIRKIKAYSFWKSMGIDH